MPSVNLSPETYEKLKKLAAKSGCSPDAAAEEAVSVEYAKILTPEEWRAEFRRVREEIQAALPDTLTEDAIQADIDAAVEEVRAERRARSR